MSSYKLTVPEGTAIFVNLICNKFLLFTPEYMRQANSSGSVITTALSFLLMLVFWFLTNRFFAEKKHFSKVFGMFLLAFFLLFTAFYLNMYIEVVKTISLIDYSLYFIGIIFIIPMIFGGLSGIKALSRTHAFFIPFVYGSMLLLSIMSFSKLNIFLLSPVLGKSIVNTARTSFFLLSLFAEFASIYALKDNFKDSSDFKKTGFYSIIISSVICLIIQSGYVMSFAEDLSFEKYPPVFQLIRQVESGQYFQRFDSLFLIMFSISSFLYLGTSLYMSGLLFAKTFNLKSSRYTILPVSFIIISICFINSLQTYITDISKYLNLFLWTIPVLLPLLTRKGKSL